MWEGAGMSPGGVLDKFVERCPAAVMVRATVERLLQPERWDEIFEAHRSHSWPRKNSSEPPRNRRSKDLEGGECFNVTGTDLFDCCLMLRTWRIRAMRVAKVITLTDEERIALTKWADGRSPSARLVLRAKLVFAAAAARLRWN